jgi:hypothetical protein
MPFIVPISVTEKSNTSDLRCGYRAYQNITRIILQVAVDASNFLSHCHTEETTDSNRDEMLQDDFDSDVTDLQMIETEVNLQINIHTESA